MRDTKTKTIGVPIGGTLKDEFQIVADLRGLSMAAELRRFIIRSVEEEKAKRPDAFLKRPEPVMAKKRRAS